MDAPNPSDVGRPPVALCHVHANVKRDLPDFLIIAPPKTGTTWIAANLRCHPGIFMPEKKELKYFSMYHRWLDLGWYAGHFREAGNRLKGEASPSYALLPCGMIRWIHALMPQLKLVFLMRDPVDRAWSHARHNFRYREAGFATYQGEFESVPHRAWRKSFCHPWLLASSDYLGQLQRWLSVFPKEQIYIDLYERLASEPEALLKRIIKFLRVDTEPINWPTFRTKEKILPGLEKELLPGLERQLLQLLQPRTRKLEHYLREVFGLCVADAWSKSLGTEANAGGNKVLSATDGAETHEVFTRAIDEDYLNDLLETELSSSEPQLLEDAYHDHNLVLHRGHFLAVAKTLGKVNIDVLNTAVTRGDDSPGILLGNSVIHLKQRVAEQMVRQLQHKERIADGRLHELEGQLEDLRAQHAALAARVSRFEPFLIKLWSSLPFRLHRKVRRWLHRSAPPQGPPRRQSFATEGPLDTVLPQKPP
jgi:hypothetical protein